MLRLDLISGRNRPAAAIKLVVIEEKVKGMTGHDAVLD
jgi:hypothetical protein